MYLPSFKSASENEAGSPNIEQIHKSTNTFYFCFYLFFYLDVTLRKYFFFDKCVHFFLFCFHHFFSCLQWKLISSSKPIINQLCKIKNSWEYYKNVVALIMFWLVYFLSLRASFITKKVQFILNKKIHT